MKGLEPSGWCMSRDDKHASSRLAGWLVGPTACGSCVLTRGPGVARQGKAMHAFRCRSTLAFVLSLQPSLLMLSSLGPSHADHFTARATLAQAESSTKERTQKGSGRWKKKERESGDEKSAGNPTCFSPHRPSSPGTRRLLNLFPLALSSRRNEDSSWGDQGRGKRAKQAGGGGGHQQEHVEASHDDCGRQQQNWRRGCHSS